MLSRLLVAGAVLVGGVALLAGCGRKAEEKVAEKMIERASGGQADVDIQSGKVRIKTKDGEAEFTAEGSTWPGDLPGEVPKFEKGKLTGTNRVSQGDTESWILVFEDVERKHFGEFIGELKSAGWKIMMTTSSEDAEIVQAVRDDLTLMTTYDGGDRGASIQVHRQSK